MVKYFWFFFDTKNKITTFKKGFHSVAKTSTSILVDKIFLDLKEAISELFQSQHYEKNLVSSIMATFADYFENGIRDSIYENYFKILSTMCLQKFANSYLEQLFVKKHVIDSKLILSKKNWIFYLIFYIYSI